MDKIVYKIEDISYKNFEKKKYVLITGYCVSLDHKQMQFNVKLNDKEVLFELSYFYKDLSNIIESKYVIESQNSGFKIFIPLEVIPRKLVLELKLGNETIILFETDNQFLKSIEERKSIDFYIDDIKYSKNESSFIISGWAYSINKDNLDFVVKNKRGEQVDFTYLSILRQDLVKTGLISVPNCGFQIKFKGNEKETFTLYFSDGENTERQKIFLENRNIITLLRAYSSLINKKNINKVMNFVKEKGVRNLFYRLKDGPNSRKNKYQLWFDDNKASETELCIQRSHHFLYNPKISIIVATFNTAEEYLKEMIDTVIDQTYTNWELCIADGSTNDFVATYIENYYADEIRIKYKKLNDNYGISENMNAALEISTGDYVGLYDHDDLLTPDCLFEIVKQLQSFPYDVLYTDEDKLDNLRQEFENPYFKPDFNIDLLRSQNYICHFLVVSRKIINEIGGMRKDFDGSQDYDFILRSVEKANKVCHIPKILYHWRMHPQSTAMNPKSKLYCYESGKKALQAHLKRINIDGQVKNFPAPLYGMYDTKYNVNGNPLVSIIFFHYSKSINLNILIEHLINQLGYSNIEFIVLNQSIDLLNIDIDNVTIINCFDQKNESEFLNLAIQKAKGDFIYLTRETIKPLDQESFSIMLGCCQRDDVGIVTGKTISKGNTILNAGIIYLRNLTIKYPFAGLYKEDDGFLCRPKINCDYSLANSMCFMMKKEDFISLGGFDSTFKKGYYDFDFSMKIRKVGKLIVYCGQSLWQSDSDKLFQGYEIISEDDSENLDKDFQLFKEIYKTELEKGDPYYNNNYNINVEPFIID